MYLKIKINTNSKKEKTIRVSEKKFDIWVKEKSENNLANKRMLEIISTELNLGKQKVRIISGHHRPNKMLEIF